MLCFIVPVKSEKVSGDWPYFSKLVDRTLHSLSNQKSDNYEIILVCHEKPDYTCSNPKIHCIHVDFEPPLLTGSEPREESRKLKELDKSNKIKKGLEYARQFNPDYFMVVDSDDMISNKIVSFVDEQDKNAPGWFVSKGYNYKEGARYVFYKNKTFNHLCGSSVIIRADLINELFRVDPWLFYVHETEVLSDNTELKPLPFPGGIYSIANGENHFMSPNYAGKIFKRYIFDINKYIELLQKISKYRIRLITNNFRNTFNFYQVKA